MAAVAEAPPLPPVRGRSPGGTAARRAARAPVARRRRRGGHGGGGAARRAGAGGRRRRGAEPGEAGGAGGFAAAAAARLPLRGGLVLGLRPGRARRLLHRPGAGDRPRRAPQPPLQVPGGRGEGAGRASPPQQTVWGEEGGSGLWRAPRGMRAPSPVVADSLDCVEWSLLTPLTKEVEAQAEKLKGRFQGDPSFQYEYAEVNAEDAERLLEDGKEPVIKEEDRLIATIDQIDRAVGIIPRGAFVKTPLGSVHENRNFEGLSLTEAKKLSSYFHFTEPVNLKNKTLLEKANWDPSTDFLDSLEHDIPQGSWTVQPEKGGAVVVLRSLLWPGLTSYHVPMTKQYGYVYFGTGEKNLDLPFML
uniref:Radial spoke head protein 9 homolog n=1 Tax=Anser cygnoides TaxID=8845 RepID=A0A8B9E3Z1_ANSCY